jgi:hypothetical protein
MLNHARTILGNFASGTYRGYDFIGEELVPTNFRPIVLPSYLQSVHRILFGQTPDRAMLNYRLAQYMTLLHATEFEQYVSALDRRCSYRNSRTSSLNLTSNQSFAPTSVRLDQPETVSSLQLVGNAAAPDMTGVMRQEFVLTVLSDRLLVEQQTGLRVSTTSELVIDGGVSRRILLADTGYSVIITDPQDGMSWQLELLLRPQHDLRQIYERAKVAGAPTLAQLFETRQDEPWDTFKALWAEHPEFAFRLIGLLLTVIYQIEEARNG